MIRPPSKTCVAFLWLLGSMLPSAVLAEWTPAAPVEQGLGPLLIRSESPAQAMRLTPLARAPVLPAAGEVEFTSMVNVASIWANDPQGKYFFDFHMADIRVGAMFGLPNGFGFEVSVNERRTLNAHLDQTTLNTHDLFGIDQNGRDTVPKNDFHIAIPAYGVEFDDHFGAFTRSLELSLARKLAYEKARSPALTMRILLRWETLDEAPPGDDAVDVGLQATLGKRFGNHLVYGNYAYTRFGNNEFYGIPLESSQFTGMLSYEWRQHDNRSWVAQYLYGEGVVVGCGELSEPSHELHLGVKWRNRVGTWQFALVENFINFNNSPDYGLSFAYSRAFSG